MFYIIYILIFAFGLIIGSFLNALIYRSERRHGLIHLSAQAGINTRINTDLSILHGRSICPKCERTLAWCDLVPVLSFIFLGGKCRYCHRNISIQYPMVELVTGMLFILIYNFSALGEISPLWGGQFTIFQLFNLVYWFYIISVLIVIFVYDLKHYIIPDKIVLSGIVVAFVWNFGFVILDLFRISDLGFRIFYINSLFAALGAAGFFFLLILISRGKWMGFGDVKLAFLMGLILGFPNILVALFTAVMAGAIIGVGLIIVSKKNLKSQIPFGPFLVGGTIFSLFLGGIVFNWYMNVFL